MPDEQRDFFISFNSADEAYAKAISDALRAEGFTTFFHPDDLEVGGYVPKWINDALLNSRQMLALCSPEYMAEGAVYSEAERYAWFWRDTRGAKFKLIHVVLKEVEFPPLLAVYKRLMATNTDPARAATAVVAALKKPEGIKEREALHGTQPNETVRQPAYVHTTRLPETGYKRLVGRDAELETIDKAWLNARINILSLVAEGGAGKSALVNEWINRLQAYDYPSAEAVLGWSFFSQGPSESATSAEEFLDWALERLGLKAATNAATDKADAIAEAMMRRRVLLLLDGIEPLQHGPGPQVGRLKDFGMRVLLRRFAATPPGAAHGLIVLTSRLSVQDIAGWKEDSAPVVDVGQLSNEAGAALLRDNGVEGAAVELRAAAHEFGGHPLALGLLASFLSETQGGNVRRRDQIRGLLSDTDNVGHDHAIRVMESYERKWLVGQPVLLAIMHMVGLFDRPASGDCLHALRTQPIIEGLNDLIIKLGDGEWRRAIRRLREVRLLAPPDPAAPDALDAHSLVREWFGEHLRQTNKEAWKVAHGRLYEHLRDTTHEGTMPTLEGLGPLYQAIAHGCRAGLYKNALEEIYVDRICLKDSDGTIIFYSKIRLGAYGNDLAAISWFFEGKQKLPVQTLNPADQAWVLSELASCLVEQRRLSEALPVRRQLLDLAVAQNDWHRAANRASNLSQAEFLEGNVDAAVLAAMQAIEFADLLDANKIDKVLYEKEVLQICSLHNAASAFLARGSYLECERNIIAARGFSNAEEKLTLTIFDTLQFDLMMAKDDWSGAAQIAKQMTDGSAAETPLLHAYTSMTLGRILLASALLRENGQPQFSTRPNPLTICNLIETAIDVFRSMSQADLLLGLIARAKLCRNMGDWEGAARDLDEVKENAEPGPMKLYLCDIAIERARLALAKIEAFAPLNELVDDSSLQLERPNQAECLSLRERATEQLLVAADYIDQCGYHRRDNELRELQAVLRGEQTFASLPPRVQ